MLRLTGGEFRGRQIQAPDDLKTRPTQAKLRQALFNSLQFEIPGARVLDLFAGSGALGFEALSRGAAHVTFVESSRPVLAVLAANAEALGCTDRCRLLHELIPVAGSQIERGAPYDLVLVDPPYSGGWEQKVLQDFPWERWLNAGGHLCLEWGTQKSKVSELPDELPFLVKVREKNYGDSVLTTYQRKS